MSLKFPTAVVAPLVSIMSRHTSGLCRQGDTEERHRRGTRRPRRSERRIDDWT